MDTDKLTTPKVKIGDLGDAPIIPILLILIGGYLAWFGVHYWRQDIKWPSDPVKSVLQGNGVPSTGTVVTSEEILTSAEHRTGSKGGGGGGGAPPVPPGASGDAAKNQNTAKILAAPYGWSPHQDAEQWNALVDLWNQESGWNQFAENGSSGAYGIPQSLPASKMASEGPDYLTNPATQIRWGLKYIKDRYGDPKGAWAHEVANDWY